MGNGNRVGLFAQIGCDSPEACHFQSGGAGNTRSHWQAASHHEAIAGTQVWFLLGQLKAAKDEISPLIRFFSCQCDLQRLIEGLAIERRKAGLVTFANGDTDF